MEHCSSTGLESIQTKFEMVNRNHERFDKYQNLSKILFFKDKKICLIENIFFSHLLVQKYMIAIYLRSSRNTEICDCNISTI